MPHISEIDSIEIDNAALELVPESVARENLVLPVRLERDGLRVIIPDGPDYDRNDTIEKLRFILEREFIVDTADREAVCAAVDYHYRARYADISNCQPQFKFRCPKQWGELKRTADRSTRFCDVCQQTVFLCFKQSELQERASKGQCVALAGEGELPVDSIGLPLYPGDGP